MFTVSTAGTFYIKDFSKWLLQQGAINIASVLKIKDLNF